MLPRDSFALVSRGTQKSETPANKGLACKASAVIQAGLCVRKSVGQAIDRSAMPSAPALSVHAVGTSATPYGAMHPAAQSETVHIEGKALWGMVNAPSRRAMHWANGPFVASQAKAFANCRHIKEICTYI
jgi:hypothetical protein